MIKSQISDVKNVGEVMRKVKLTHCILELVLEIYLVC